MLYISKVMTIINFCKKIKMATTRTGNEPHGTIFKLGNITIRYLLTQGIPKMYIKKIALSGAWNPLVPNRLHVFVSYKIFFE